MIVFDTNQHGELLCTCGNTPANSGFDPCDIQGRVDHSLLNADSKHALYYICNRCNLFGGIE